MKVSNGAKHFTALLLALVLILSGLSLTGTAAQAAETDPAKMIYTDYGESYHLTSFLNGYNVIAFGSVTMQTHCMGALLIEGNLEGGVDYYADGSNLPPTYIKGFIEARAMYNGRSSKNNPPLYVGTSNVVTTNEWDQLTVNGMQVGWGNSKAYATDSFFNFDEAYEVIKADAQSIIRRAEVFDPATDTSEEANPKVWLAYNDKNQWCLNVKSGANVVIESLEGIDCISLVGDVTAAVNTTITLLDSGHVELPDFLENESQMSSVEQSDVGMSVVWNIPNASYILLNNSPWFGHILAPDADIEKKSGNYNGCLIGQNVILGGGAEGHVYRYNTTETSWDIVFSLEKIWDDGDNADGIRPKHIEVQLLADGKAHGPVVRLSEKENWYHVWTGLPETDADGNEIVYTVEEKNVPAGYTASYDASTQTLTNYHKYETTEISGKKTWMDGWWGSRMRPMYITLRLYADGHEVASQTLQVTQNGNEQTYTFKDLPKKANGKEIKYTVTEDTVSSYVATINGFDIVNAWGQATEITGKKVWDDANNQDGYRPESITVELLANGKVIDEHVVYATDNWEFSFTNLPMFEYQGYWPVAITYTVREKKVPAHYTEAKVEADENNPHFFTITNTHEVEKTNLSGRKTWDDDNNNDGIRPEEITVILMADHVEVDRQTVTAANGWKWTFKDKPKYHGGKLVNYTVTDSVTGYTPVTNGMNLTNRHENETLEVSGAKTWYVPEGVTLPESITIELWRDDKLYKTQEVRENADGEWKWSFTDLPKYTKQHEHVYTIKEKAVDGYITTVNGYDVTNTYNKTSVSGEKTWEVPEGVTLPAGITINLLANDKEIAQKTVTAADGWKWAFEDLDLLDKNGDPITYTISEDPIKGYTSEVSGYDVTNTYSQTSVSGAKTWNHGDNKKLPTSITIKLMNGTTVVETKEVTAADNWAWEFTNLPLTDASGNVITYTIAEEPVDGYKSAVNGYDVTNTYDRTSVSGAKTWNHGDNKKLPTSITIKLMNGTTVVETKEVTAADNWAWEFTNLPLTDASGNVITYTIAEEPVDGYKSAVNGYDVTNTYDRTSVSGAKTWNHGTNPVDKQPASITIKLMNGTTVVETKEVTAADNWAWEFTNLPLTDANGVEIKYSIVEETVENYESKIDGYNVTNTYHSNALILTAAKTINGEPATELHDDMFTFVLKDAASGQELQRVTNKAAVISFAPIDYTLSDVGKTYEYMVSEAGAKHNAYKLDDTVYTVKVKIGQAADGSITVDKEITNGKEIVQTITFNNEYAAYAAMALSATKTVNGYVPSSVQVFDFSVVSRAGRAVATGQNVGDVINFTPIVFTEEDLNQGILTFTFEEDTPPGYTFETVNYTVMVKLTDKGDGTIGVEYTFADNGAAVDAVELQNSYDASGFALIKAEKTINGSEPTDAQVFEFELVDKAGNVVQTKQNVKGAVTFDAIPYELSDAGKTYEYTIREKATTLEGVTIDSRVYTAQVAVTDKGDGTLDCAVTYKLGDSVVSAAAFDNKYNAGGFANLKATKTVNGSEPTDVQVFEFELVDKAGNVVQTKQNVKGAVTFDAIPYKLSDAGKTYEYTIREKATTLEGVTIDSRVYTALVAVTDKGDGTLDCAVTYKLGDAVVSAAAFDNKYNAGGFANLKATKTVNGSEPTDVQVFEFELVDKAGNVVQTKQNVKGAVTFDAIPYKLSDAGKTYEYTIREKATTLEGVTIDSRVYTALVAVTDKGDGTLDCAVTYKLGDAVVSAAAFDNTLVYEANGSVSLKAVKTVNGNTPTAEQTFYFQLKDDAGNVIQTSRNYGGNVYFSPLRYTQDDIGETYTYTIEEYSSGVGMIMDTRRYTVTVTISDNGDGTLDCAAAYSLDGIRVSIPEFNNRYEATGSMQLTASKMINGQTPDATQSYTFELLNANGVVIQRAINSGSSIAFAPIHYTMSDVGNGYDYTVRESLMNAVNGMVLDSREYQVHVLVIDNGDGTLRCEPEITLNGQPVSEIVFSNIRYTEASAVLTATKAVNGNVPTAAQVFSFELADENGQVLQTVQNNGGSITFAPISYTAADMGKTYTYTIRESAAENLLGMTADERVYGATVTVTGDGSGTLSCAVSYSLNGQAVLAAAFNNTYAAEAALNLTATKTVNGKTPTATQLYEFELRDENGNVLQTVSNTCGDIAFAPVRYTLADAGKTFTYTAREKTASTVSMQADARVYTVTVTVADNGDGTLQVNRTIAQDGLAVNAIAFSNQELSSLSISKEVVGGDAQASFTFTLSLKAANGATLTGSYPCTGTEQTTISSGAIINLKDGQTITITGLPVGATWTVEEAADARYSTTVNGVSGRTASGVVGMGSSTAAFRNTFRETDFSVTKVWQGERGGEITLTLYANGVKLDAQPTWTVSGDVYSCDDLPMYDAAGERIVYSATETYMDGYTTIYQNVMPNTAVTNRVLDGGTIINRAMTEVSVRKVWTGLEADEAYPAIILTLYCNGEIVDAAQPEPDKYGWYTWRNLPATVNGEPAVYTVAEEPMEGYATTYTMPDGTEADYAVSGGTITNHRIPATGDDAPLTLWVAMLGLSAAGLLLLSRRRAYR